MKALLFVWNRLLLSCLVAFLIGVAVPATAAVVPSNGGGWTMTWLELDVDVQPQQKTIRIDGAMTLRLEQDRSDGPTIALFKSGQPVVFFSAHAQGLAGEEVEATLRRQGQKEMAHLRFDQAFQRGDEVEVTFVVENEGRMASQFHVDPRIAMASWTSGWYPAPVPARADDLSSTAAAAPGITRIEMPAAWRSVCHGELVERAALGDRVIEVWEDEQAIARSFAAGPYQVARHRIGEREVSVYRLGPSPKDAELQARSLAESLEVMERRFGPYPYGTCHLAEVPAGLFSWYAASQQGFIVASSVAFQFGANRPLFAHEASHGWWGNLVRTRGPGSILCSESLAQYGALLAIEELEGPEAAANFLGHSRLGYVMNQCARGYFALVRNGQDIPLATLQGQGVAHQLSDAKGHWMYHMLRRRVGDEVFFSTLRGLTRDFASRSISLDDLRQAFVAAAPESARLESFFEQWLERTGAPLLESSFEVISEGPESHLALRIDQQGEPFELWLDVAVETEHGVTTHRVITTGATTRVELPVDGDVTGVHLDPKRRLLMWRAEYGERPEVPAHGTSGKGGNG